MRFPVNFVKFSKNTFSHRTPLVAASENVLTHPVLLLKHLEAATGGGL